MYEDLNVWDYLDYFARLYHLHGKARQRRLQEVLDLVNLSHKRHSPTHKLSRGMKQRLGLARTIIHDPAILLLDEPVSGLDPIARQEFREVMTILHGLGTTILISSHLLSDLAELCTHVGIMEMGCLVESTTLTELYDRFCRPALQLTLLGTATELADLLPTLAQMPQMPQIQDLQWLSEPHLSPAIVQFHYSGTHADRVALLRGLVAANFPILEYRLIQENLEDIFLKIGHTQAI